MIAIIPARGGSKGLPGKNIKDLFGKPLIVYTIEAALESKYIDRVVVSTDDEEIADLSLRNGAEVPFLRPEHLASDKAAAIDAYLYTIEKLEGSNASNIDFVVLQPTSPLRNSEDIDNAIGLFRRKNADSIISVREALHPPVWSKKIDNDGVLRDYFEANNKNRQEIPPAFMPNGAIYVFKYSLLKNSGTYYSNNTFPFIMPVERSFDIDTLHDFILTELYLKNIGKRNG